MAAEDRRLTHLDEHGRAQMVDVGGKETTRREAAARGLVVMQPETLQRILSGTLPKGDVLATARVAGIMAAKRTAELIPLCHTLLLTHVEIQIEANPNGTGLQIEATVRTQSQTGVEMEALTAVSITALTLYDMCKAVDRDMRIDAIRLVRKQGGRSGDLLLEA
jgi:cyclic pyranopterin phosphate synthase